MEWLAFLFWASALLLGYTYVGYPLLLAAWPKGRGRTEGAREKRPYSVTIIVSVYNEKRYIRKKVRNALDAVGGTGQVIVVSDGSDDGTLDIARSIQDRRLMVLNNSVRRGKAYSLRKALPLVRGEISVFTDANVFFDKGALEALVEPFSDPLCGGASGRVDLVALDDGEPLGEGLYMRYERFLQASESRLGTTVGADGGMLAVRTALVPNVPSGLILDDLFIVLKVIESGHSIRYIPGATGREPVPARVKQEFRRKVRIAAGGFQLLGRLALIRTPWRWPLAGWMFFSHKLLRWISGVFVLTALGANLALAPASNTYAILLGGQAVMWTMGILAWMVAPLRGTALFYPVYYFGAMNLASLVGLWQALLRRQSGTWQRVDR